MAKKNSKRCSTLDFRFCGRFPKLWSHFGPYAGGCTRSGCKFPNLGAPSAGVLKTWLTLHLGVYAGGETLNYPSEAVRAHRSYSAHAVMVVAVYG